MATRKICDDTADMSMWELAHNFAYVKDGMARYRDFERDISALDLMREIITKNGDPNTVSGMTDDELSEMLADDLQYGTTNLDGVFAALYMALWGTAEVREWLKDYENQGLPTTIFPDVLEDAVHTYGKDAQIDVAIEEMSELTKALLKERRAAKHTGLTAVIRARQCIYEKMADVIIMLMQLLMIFDDREFLQKIIDEKVIRLDERLKKSEHAEKSAASGAAQDVIQLAT